MKLFYSFLGMLFLIGLANQSFAQSEVVDTRIDNMSYWMNMARKGLVPYNPVIPIAPAEFKGSQIQAKGVKTLDSPDVPVTNLTNVTESENSVFINPNNNQYILNSNNSTSWSGGSVGSLYGANYFQSGDAGTTWGGSYNGAGGANSGDPTTAIGLNGRQYVNYISSSDGQGIAYTDNAVSWTTATIAPNPGSLADKNHMWIDNSATSPYEGNLYTAWTDFGGTDDSQIKISRSTNDAVTWSTGVNLSSAILAGSHNQGVNIQTGPGGQVYVTWAVYDSWPSDETALGFAKSTNGGVSYSAATRIISNIRGIRTTAVLKSMRVNSFPSMAVDISNGPNSGNIYIVWTNTGVPGTNTGTNKSVYLIRSTNGGTTWSTPIRVNQGTFAEGKESYSPWISCDSETGTLSVIFYDDRATASTACETWVAYSVDAGTSWTDFKVSDVSFTPSPISGLASSYMGDYLGITSKGGRVYPCWTDTRGGLFMTYVSPFIIGLNAGFTASATTVCTGSSVTFTDQSSGPPTSWTWSFPGGSPSSFIGKVPPSIAYNTPGTYNVTLVVSDGITTDTETKTGLITVAGVFANFSGTPTPVFVGNTVTFTDNSLCTPTSWNWTFNGGTPAAYSGQNPPPITYSTLGTYDVSLTVTKGSSSDTKTRTGYINVLPPEFIMSSTTVTTCTGNFYDPGGSTGNYSDGQDFTMVFNPGITGNALRFVFSSFLLESQTSCSYDYLKIYDGNSISAALLGTYCGSTSPGTVTANNSTGSLTFVFHSDVSLNYSGWVAAVTCVSGIVANPGTFTATPFSSSQINLGWTKNASNNNVMVVWSATSTFGTPVNGTTYSAGNPLPGGGTILYLGSGISFNHTLLNTNTTYYYKAFSYDNVHAYSTGMTANATTLCGTATLPFSESFSGTTLPNCWSTQISGTGAVNKWTVSTTNRAGGTANEMMSTYQNINPATTRLITPPLNTTGMTLLNLNFKHFLDAYAAGATLRIQSSTDKVTWTNETWSIATTATNVGPATVSTTVTNNLNSPNTYIAFIIEGDLYEYDYWYIDDVSITGNAPTARVLNLTLYLEGIYAGNAAMRTAMDENGAHWGTTIADKITVELHSSSNYSTILYSTGAISLNTNGTATATIPGTYSGSYYMTIKNRNHIETVSAALIAFSTPTINYSFDTPSKAYGANMGQMTDGRWVLYAGDANQDGIIDGSDLSNIENLANNASSGYLPEDINGDGLVDGSDLSAGGNNADMAIGASTP